MILEGRRLLIHGKPILENWALPENRMVHDQINDVVYIPDNGTIYKLIFANGLTEKAIDMACQFAYNKVIGNLTE